MISFKVRCLFTLHDLHLTLPLFSAVHEWLWVHGDCLHRDISMANIMVREAKSPTSRCYGVINDFDLSIRKSNMNKDPTSKFRTGTRPYQAYDILAPKDIWKGGHMYRHDLESIFYVVLILACHYAEPDGHCPKNTSPYRKWFTGSRDDVYNSKGYEVITSITFQPDTWDYYAGFKKWLLEIRRDLKKGYNSRPDSDDVLDEKYDWETLKGHVTYSMFKQAMHKFQEKELILRSDTPTS